MLTQLRDEFDMVGVPARLLLRGNSDNPFEKRKKFQSRTSSVLYGKDRKPKPAAPANTASAPSSPKSKAKPSPKVQATKPKGDAKTKTRKQQTGHFKPRRFK